MTAPFDSYIKFEVSVSGDGGKSNPYRPAVYDTYPKSQFHFDAETSDSTTATVYVDKDMSPVADVDAIRSEKAPLGTVLEEI